MKHSKPAKKNPMVTDTKDLSLLGKGSMPPVDEPCFSLLETFASSVKRPYKISFSSNEFTSFCPVTGQPDFGTIIINYVPKDRCIETKSLKLYLQSFRNLSCFAETLVNRILDDIVEATSPRSATVIGEFAPRGGIDICVEASYPASKVIG
ncbi:MAG: preQ(1) synthase [Chthoniobacterales bacterium]